METPTMTHQQIEYHVSVVLIIGKGKSGYVSVKIHVIPDIQIDDIDLYVKTSKGHGRGTNDSNNKIRERILSILPSMTMHNSIYKTFLKDERWQYVRCKLMATLSCLLEKEGKSCDTIQLVLQAGRAHNYDFKVFFYKENELVHCIDELEFKNGGNNVTTKVPQQLSLQTRSEHGNFIRKQHYDEHFYFKYLPHIVTCYKEKNIDLNLPPINQYVKLVKTTDAKVHDSFKAMKDNEKLVEKGKGAIVDQSIHDYLIGITTDIIDFNIIQGKLYQSQANKTYLLWDGQEFHIDYIKHDELVLDQTFELKFGRNQLANTLVLHTKNKHKQWELLLRWRNRKGIQNPAWQIKLRDCQ